MSTDRQLLCEVEAFLDLWLDDHASSPLGFPIERLLLKVQAHLNQEAEEHDEQR